MKNKRKGYQLGLQFDDKKINKKNMKVIECPNTLIKLQNFTSCQVLPRIVKPYIMNQQIKNRAMRSDKQLQRIKNKVKESCVTSREMFDKKLVFVNNNTYDVNVGRQTKMNSKRQNRENRLQSVGKENVQRKVMRKQKNEEEDHNLNSQLTAMKSFFNVIHNKLKNVQNRSRGHRHTFDSLDFQIGQSKQNSKNYSQLLKASSLLDKNYLDNEQMSPRIKLFRERERPLRQMVVNIGQEITKLQRMHENNESRLRMCMNEQLDILDMQYYLKLLKNVGNKEQAQIK